MALAGDDDNVAGSGPAEGFGDGLAAVLDFQEVASADAAGAFGMAADLVDDGRGVFRARVLAGEDGEVGTFGGRPADAAPAAGVALAGCPADDDESAPAALAGGPE